MTKKEHAKTVEYRANKNLIASKRKVMELQDIYNRYNEQKDLNCLCTFSDREKFLNKYWLWYNFRK